MKYAIKDETALKKLLWLDALLGGITALISLLGYQPLTAILGVTTSFVLGVATLHLVYATWAFLLALQPSPSVKGLRWLIGANWGWAAGSVLMIFSMFSDVTLLGRLLLMIQPILVGGLAYLENSQLLPMRAA